MTPVTFRTFRLRAPLALLAAAVAATPAAARTRSTGVPVTLPAPTGPHRIGTVSLRLVDRSRPDPWVPSQPCRQLMISVWYPALPTPGQQLAPYLAPGVAELLGNETFHGIPPGHLAWAAVRTHAWAGAPVDHGPRRRPVVIYSPGSGDPRTWGTTLVEELASHGYVVVTIDHTYEAPGVAFPDGSVRDNARVLAELAEAVRTGTVPAWLEKLLRVRVADTRFLLDRLATLPHGLAGVVDPHRVGVVGQSAGGITAAQGMYEDSRITAGIDLDGTLEYNQEPNGTNLMPVAVHGLRRPFLLMGREGSDHTTEPSWGAFWSASRGWRRDLTIRGSRHQTYTDLVAVMPQLGLPAAVVERGIGTVDPGRALAAKRAYVVSFFDRWLYGRDDHLLDGPSPRYPEVAFVW